MRNYDRIYREWASTGSPGGGSPRALWFSDVASPPGSLPRVLALPEPDWQERWVKMLGAAWAAVGAAEGASARDAVAWWVLCDDDTYFFLPNLLSLLGSLDASAPHYLGGASEDLAVSAALTRMAMGGGGVAVSAPLLAKIPMAALAAQRR